MTTWKNSSLRSNSRLQKMKESRKMIICIGKEKRKLNSWEIWRFWRIWKGRNLGQMMKFGGKLWHGCTRRLPRRMIRFEIGNVSNSCLRISAHRLIKVWGKWSIETRKWWTRLLKILLILTKEKCWKIWNWSLLKTKFDSSTIWRITISVGKKSERFASFSSLWSKTRVKSAGRKKIFKD